VVICLERGADLHMAQQIPLPLTVSCPRKIQIGFTFLVPAHPGSPGQRAVKRLCVCVCVCVMHRYLQLSQRSTRIALYCRSILLVFVRSCSSISNKIISLKKFISPQLVGGPQKEKNLGPWACAQCAQLVKTALQNNASFILCTDPRVRA